MNGRVDRRVLFVAALLALIGLVLVVARFRAAAEDESALARGREGDLRHAGRDIRRRANSSRRVLHRPISDGEAWEPFIETEAERRRIPVRVHARILETGKPLVGADVSLLARQVDKGWRRMFHGRLEEPGLYFFRMPQGYEAVGVRVINGPAADQEGAFVAGSFFVAPEPAYEGFDLHVFLSQAPMISGRVVDAATGVPIAAAEVLIKGGEWRKPWATGCNEQGEFALRALRFPADEIPAVLDLVVAAPGHVERALAVELSPGQSIQEGVEVALAPAHRLGGRIRDERGSALSNLELILLVEPGEGRAPIRSVEALLETTSDGGGHFVFTGVPGGRVLEVRLEAEGFLPARLRVDPLENDRGDLDLRLRRGRRVGLDLVSADGAGVSDRVVRVFGRDEQGDWFAIPLDVMSESREIVIRPDRKTEILVFVQAKGSRSRPPATWCRGRVTIDPAENLDRVTVPLEGFTDERQLAPAAGLGVDCAWGVQVVVDHPGESEELCKIFLGRRGQVEDYGPISFQFLVAPGQVVEFNAAGAAPQRYLVVGEPGSRLRVEARSQPAERATRR